MLAVIRWVAGREILCPDDGPVLLERSRPFIASLVASRVGDFAVEQGWGFLAPAAAGALVELVVMLVARAAVPKVEGPVDFGLALFVRGADDLLPASGNNFLLKWAEDRGDIAAAIPSRTLDGWTHAKVLRHGH